MKIKDQLLCITMKMMSSQKSNIGSIFLDKALLLIIQGKSYPLPKKKSSNDLIVNNTILSYADFVRDKGSPQKRSFLWSG